MAANQNTQTLTDRVLPVTRILAVIIVPILAAAFLMLYLFPNHSGVLFAWPIKPQMSAMMLGATYLGGVYFFAMVAASRQWHTVRLGFWPVTTFAAVMGIATVLHWDKFTPGHISFILWAFLYFTLPFVIPVVWYINQRANPGFKITGEAFLPRALRLAEGGLGAVLTGASLVLLVFPVLMIPSWPWTMTPLTARAMAAMFALSGLVGIGVAVDGYLSSARILLQSQVVAVLLFLVALVFARGDIFWDRWQSWMFVAGLLLQLGIAAWALLQPKRNQPSAQPQTTV